MSATRAPRPREVLLVEDDSGDVNLIQEALDKCGVPVNLNTVDNGVEALQYLHQQEKYARAARPELILLDLNLPKKDGREVLAEIKSTEIFASIPVVVLTTSNSQADVIQTYKLHANSFITKNADVHIFFHTVHAIVNYWFTVSTLP